MAAPETTPGGFFKPFGAWLRGRPFLLAALFTVPVATLVRVAVLKWVWIGPGVPLGWDLLSLLTGSRIFESSDGGQLYDLDLQRRVALEHYPELLTVVPPGPFVSPPFVALLLRPLVPLPFRRVFAGWTLAGIGAASLAVRPLLATPRGRVWAILMTAPPFVGAALSGQPTLFTFAIVVLAYRAMTRERFGWAGALCAVLLVKPQSSLGLLLYFAIRTRGRTRVDFALGWLSVAGALVGASLIANPWGSLSYVEFAINTLPHLYAIARIDPAGNLSWRAFFILLLGGQSKLGEALAFATVLIGATACVRSWVTNRIWVPRSRRDAALDFSGAVVLALWCAPHAFSYDWTVVAIPFLLLWQFVPEKRDEWTAVFAVLNLAIFASAPIASALASRFGAALQLGLPVLGWLAYVCHRMLPRSSPASPPSPPDASLVRGP